MSNCPPEEHLGAFLDGELPETQALAIRAHVLGCRACSRELAALRALDRLAASAPLPQVSPAEWGSTWAAVSARLAGAQRARDRRVHSVVWRRAIAFATAAAACLAIAAGAFALLRRPAVGPPEQARECVLEDLEAGAGYSASVSYSADAQVVLITVSPTASEESPAHGPTRGTL